MGLIKRIDRIANMWLTQIEISPTHAEVQFYEPELPLEQKVDKLWDAHPELHK